MHRIRDTLTQVQNRINEAASLCGRNADEITLLAVSKKQAAEKIRAAHNEGLTHFGENYLQEALEKQSTLSDTNIQWHFIGPIQSNKTRPIAENFSWVHSVDRLKIAQRLSEQRPAHLDKLNICLQINIDREETKSGILEEQLNELVAEIVSLPMITLRGLMVIPSNTKNEDSTRNAFSRTRQHLHALNNKFQLSLDTLSMGMSSDLGIAIAEGATVVRIGTALFGQRP